MKLALLILFGTLLAEAWGQGSVFPIIDGSESTWNWAHDGTNVNGVVTFLADGRVKWDNGRSQGFWRLLDGGTILETEFNRIEHTLYYENEKATLIRPIRSPPSTMIIVSGMCPHTHPNAFSDGDQCCSSDQEAFDWQYGDKCDGTQIRIDSKCCLTPSIPCPAGKCSNYEVQTGPQGHPGMVGPAGDMGEPGDQGPAGDDDYCRTYSSTRQYGAWICDHQGVKGEAGVPGITGSKGEAGEPGYDGKDEEDGSPGEMGFMGSPGSKGYPGDDGFDGNDGVHGSTGTANCNSETCFLRLEQCYETSSITLSVQCREGYAAVSIWRNDKELWELECCQIQGSDQESHETLPGPAGNPGKPGSIGEEGETGDQGASGDDDYCTSPDNISTTCGLVGEKGEAGPLGGPGLDGEAGEPGYDGNDGEDGPPGLPGSMGSPGNQGQPGVDGIPGLNGEPGLDGKICNSEQCALELGHCYAISSITLTVQCRNGYGAASVWRNSEFWGLRCCKIVGRYETGQIG